MTAYLRPGDRIHLVIPSATSHGLVDASQHNLTISREAYAKLGIEIFDWDISQTLQAPVIVAVIRPPVFAVREAGSTRRLLASWWRALKGWFSS